MSQLQYIGARYVPVWYENSQDQTADWEVNVEYEPLTFVTTQNNHLYLSKKTVPDNIGTPAQNTEYWLDMGAFVGSYADLKAEIGELGDLDTTDKTSIVNAINEIVGDLEDTNTRIDHVLDSINLFIGDSWSSAAYGDSTYIAKIATALSTGEEHHELAIGGAGFVGAFGGYNFTNLIDALAANITDDDKPKVKKIYVFGGANDGSANAETLAAAVDTFVDHCVELFANCEVTYVHCTGDWAKIEMANHALLPQINNNRFTFVAGYPNVFVTTSDYDSTGHPKTDKNLEWADWVINLCKSHDYQVWITKDISGAISGRNTYVSGEVNYSYMNKLAYLKNGYNRVKLNVPVAGFQYYAGNPILMEFAAGTNYDCPMADVFGIVFIEAGGNVYPVRCFGTFVSERGSYLVLLKNTPSGVTSVANADIIIEFDMSYPTII